MWKFMQSVNRKRGLDMQTFRDLYAWSVGERRTEFWEDLWEEAGLIHEGSFDEVVDTTAPMNSIPHWFHGTRLNFAENILYTSSPTSSSVRTTANKEPNKIALTSIREANTSIRHLTCSTDMGTKGILERLVQIRPVYVFIDDWTVYNGKTVDLRPKIREIVKGLRGVREFRGVVMQPRFEGQPADLEGMERCMTVEGFLKAGGGDKRLRFERVGFRDPFLIVYSSGTTGVPKCIVHSVGGVLVSVLKEGRLHRELGPDTVQLQYTTTGWIMYLVSIQALLYGSRSILYDGSPFQPDLTTFLRILSEQRVTDLGTSPRYLQELHKHSIAPRDTVDLSALRAVTSTGMVLSDSLFEWFYDTAFPPSVHLSNISGGTDLAACFGMENPLEPVYVGGCQGPSLGTKVEVYDSTIESGPGHAVPDGVPGELVATASFPNQPVFFWGDENGEKYANAYYTRFPHVWTHGDFIQVHPVTKQILFLGRADGVLNPSGVRFGSSDIYSVIETHFAEVADSMCVGQRRQHDADESVLLFLKMAEGGRFTDSLVEKVKRKIGEERSKRHIPKYVFQTWDIPTTVNLKKVELPVKQIVSGRIIKPSGTLANPESLQFYYQFANVEEVVERMESEKTQNMKSKL
ncbi:acetyl-coenzyme A synthetase [Lindgomyces ingoldianus]|uniref:Acetyl-coenzyme A synthetase n=1 Tax=Lindgomyces ingoldianus TaxID=673940 RepID=A0ACB6Q9H4_9PLEO|nr:acetyl-coenzyme A synthetase [Lindgomyces ingoldianus]KAF2462785.1 acetyl-coenzyme A synthetase [Lindgomyces ingoldianus]